jgi:hypothetical protein
MLTNDPSVIFFFFVIRAWSICPGCTAVYGLIVTPPLDVSTFAARRRHVHTTREILAAKGGTVARMLDDNFA